MVKGLEGVVYQTRLQGGCAINTISFGIPKWSDLLVKGDRLFADQGVLTRKCGQVIRALQSRGERGYNETHQKSNPARNGVLLKLFCVLDRNQQGGCQTEKVRPRRS